jgi:hypothetical protein
MLESHTELSWILVERSRALAKAASSHCGFLLIKSICGTISRTVVYRAYTELDICACLMRAM